eukprot:3367948-Rhodomonas_salina.2
MLELPLATDAPAGESGVIPSGPAQMSPFSLSDGGAAERAVETAHRAADRSDRLAQWELNRDRSLTLEQEAWAPLEAWVQLPSLFPGASRRML